MTDPLAIVGRKIVGRELEHNGDAIEEVRLFLDDGTCVKLTGEALFGNVAAISPTRAPVPTRILTSDEVPAETAYNVPIGSGRDSLMEWIEATFGVVADRPTVVARDEATALEAIKRLGLTPPE